MSSSVRPSQAIKDVPKRRTGLLKDNSWIKRDREEEETVDVDPNYGRDVLLRTRPNNESKPGEATLTSPAAAVPSISSLTKRFNGNQEGLPNKSSIASTSKSSATVATSPTTTSPNKPPVPAKNPTLTTASKSFTARVFSGASSNEKAFSPVKRSVDEKPPVSKEQPKVPNDDNSAPLSPVLQIKPATSSVTKSESKPSVPQSTTGISTSQTTATFTSPEKTQPPTATKTEHSKSYEQSNGSADPNTTTPITTTPKMSMSNIKSTSKTLDTASDVVIPTLSPTVHSSPVSAKSESKPSVPQATTGISTSPKNPDTLSYSSSQPASIPSMTVRSDVKQTSTTSVQSPPVKSPPLPQFPSKRIAGRRDLCSFCGKSIVEGERMILDDLQIFSHLTCFKCELCFRSLGSLEAGASLWVHREMVNCENCYKRTKDQWFH